jgi:hypothetical protein
MLNVPAMQPAAARRRATTVAPWWPDADTLGWWPFGVTGNFNDQTTPAYNFSTSPNPPTINSTGGVANSVQFVAANGQYLTRSAIPTSGSSSAAIWIRFATVQQAWIYQQRGYDRGFWQIVYVFAEGGLAAWIQTSDNTVIGPATILASPSANTWYCVGFTIDNAAKSLIPYLNGEAKTSVSFAGKTPAYTGVLRVGGAFNNTSLFNGRANDALYVQRALSAVDHLAFYNGTKAYYGIA